MRISGFVHGITNPELIKRFHEKIPKTIDEMMQVATSFLQGQEVASNQERKKVPQAWRHQEGGHRQNFKKRGGFRSQHKTEKRPDKFTLLTKTPKEILALEKGKFKTPPPMTTPVEKRNANKFCEFHGEVGHNTDECNHLRKQIEDMLKAGKLPYIIRELKQSSGKEQPKKKVRQKITQSFSPDLEISFPSLGNNEGAEGPLIIEAKVEGHKVHRMCIDGGSSFEILYEHCFNQLRPEIRNQMVPATTSLVGFSGEIIWPLGQITLLVKVGDDEYLTSAWMDFMVIAEHKLNVRKGCQPVRQKKRGQAAERNIVINDEVSKLVTAGIMREVHYHDWLSNPVMVKKSGNSWRMCVDFKDLNKACPKDGYPLPEIDWKVESLCGFPFKCFLDAYKGYHQIRMAEEDEEKTAFLAKSAEKSLPFFKTLKKCTKKSDFLWTEEAEAVFKQIKEHIAKLPILTAPEEQEELIVYLEASKEAVSAVLMMEREARQMSIYFVSRALRGPEVNYTAMEKLVLALVHASKRLRRYFQAHPITVITNQPIKNILSNPEVASRMQKWSIQLGEFGIHYRPRVSVKGQVEPIYHRKTRRRRSGRLHKRRRTAPGTVDPVHGRVILR
ncbi:reverse transcriptase domain-containing protein [Tanacetum coccineum]